MKFYIFSVNKFKSDFINIKAKELAKRKLEAEKKKKREAMKIPLIEYLWYKSVFLIHFCINYNLI
jgi:hypothetical protein